MDPAQSLYQSALAARAAGDLVACRRHLAAAAAAAPAEPHYPYALGVTCQLLGDAAAAETAYRAALDLAPDLSAAAVNLAVALRQLQRPAEAEACFRAVLAREPGHALALLGLGRLLASIGRPAEALPVLVAAVDAAPTESAARLELAELHRLADRPAEALAHYQAGLALAPGDGSLSVGLGRALNALDRWSEARPILADAVARRPDLAFGWSALATAELMHGAAGAAAAAYRRAIAADPAAPVLRSGLAFTLHYLPEVDGAAILDAARAFETACAQGLAPMARTSRPSRGRMRVAYLSGDLCQHPVAAFVEPLWRHHDRSAVEIVAIATGPQDSVTARLRALADRWHDAQGLDDAQVAALIAAEGVDIAIDLAGHTASNRLLALARRPAPVQMTWLGHPGTTGLSAVDWRLTDAVADPLGAEAHHAEELLRLPQGFLCWQPPADAPAPALPPAGTITFGSFNLLPKLSEPTLAAWGRLLAVVPGSRLLLKSRSLVDPGVRGALLARLAALDVAADRVELVGWAASHREHLALYGRVDIALDPFPYNGTTTTCEALWMGVPVVTLAGDRHAARVGASLLAQVGLGELVADSVAGYVAIAADLARDSARRSRLRATLRGRMAASPLCDGPGFAGRFEAALRAARDRATRT